MNLIAQYNAMKDNWIAQQEDFVMDTLVPLMEVPYDTYFGPWENDHISDEDLEKSYAVRVENKFAGLKEDELGNLTVYFKETVSPRDDKGFTKRAYRKAYTITNLIKHIKWIEDHAGGLR